MIIIQLGTRSTLPSTAVIPVPSTGTIPVPSTGAIPVTKGIYTNLITL